MGRPTLYDPEKLILVEGWARDGLTNEQIAEKLGIDEATLYRWQEKYSEFCEALKKGKEIIDREVENALLKHTQGYTVELRKTFKVKVIDYDTNGRKVRETEKLQTGVDEVYVAPDTTAQIFWLKNRKPAEWRDKREFGVTDKDGNDVGVVVLPAVVSAER